MGENMDGKIENKMVYLNPIVSKSTFNINGLSDLIKIRDHHIG